MVTKTPKFDWTLPMLSLIEPDQSRAKRMSVAPLMGCSKRSVFSPARLPPPVWVARAIGVAGSLLYACKYAMSWYSSRGAKSTQSSTTSRGSSSQGTGSVSSSERSVEPVL